MVLTKVIFNDLPKRIFNKFSFYTDWLTSTLYWNCLKSLEYITDTIFLKLFWNGIWLSVDIGLNFPVINPYIALRCSFIRFEISLNVFRPCRYEPIYLIWFYFLKIYFNTYIYIIKFIKHNVLKFQNIILFFQKIYLRQLEILIELADHYFYFISIKLQHIKIAYCLKNIFWKKLHHRLF